MKKTFDSAYYLSFFRKELTENLLYFWMDRCLDEENGGYFNCFSNDGSKRVSTDKYTWSQGRFLWMFSRLSTMESALFNEEERARFLAYAKSGYDFLRSHVLMGEEDYRCVFLMDAQGNPKRVGSYEGYDLSISADCFVVMGFAAYALAAKEKEAWEFAKTLGQSVWQRYQSGNFRSLPYPVTEKHCSHAKPMILTNVCCELYKAALVFEPAYALHIREQIAQCHEEVFDTFLDEEGLVHEFTRADGSFGQYLFCRHINPGHTLEDMWFQLEAGQILGTDRHFDTIQKVVCATMELGWDKEYGGLFHFVPCDGLHTQYALGEGEQEPQMALVLDDWGSKLWWVHSEAMYTTLLMYCRTGKEQFLELFQRVFTYTYDTFPNPDRKIREWIQIRTREGDPQEKVVALPVKDPYHIIRNVLMIVELLEKEGRNV